MGEANEGTFKLNFDRHLAEVAVPCGLFENAGVMTVGIGVVLAKTGQIGVESLQ